MKISKGILTFNFYDEKDRNIDWLTDVDVFQKKKIFSKVRKIFWALSVKFDSIKKTPLWLIHIIHLNFMFHFLKIISTFLSFTYLQPRKSSSKSCISASTTTASVKREILSKVNFFCNFHTALAKGLLNLSECCSFTQQNYWSDLDQKSCEKNQGQQWINTKNFSLIAQFSWFNLIRNAAVLLSSLFISVPLNILLLIFRFWYFKHNAMTTIWHVAWFTVTIIMLFQTALFVKSISSSEKLIEWKCWS